MCTSMNVFEFVSVYVCRAGLSYKQIKVVARGPKPQRAHVLFVKSEFCLGSSFRAFCYN